MLPVFVLMASYGVWLAYQRNLDRQDLAARAVRVASSSGMLKDQLGEPVKIGYWVSGRVIDPCCDRGTADLQISVSGPKGSGVLDDWSQSSFTGWRVCSLVFHSKSGPDVAIVPDATSKCERE
jgi:hypothetical protein